MRVNDKARMTQRTAAETAITDCLRLGADETLVIVTDDDRRAIADALYTAAQTVTDDVTLVQYPPGEQHGEEPPAVVADALASGDAFLAPTTKSLSHTRARQQATDAGVRGATLPGITETVFEAGVAADYEAIATESARIYEAVSDAATVRVETPAGTDVTFDVTGRTWQQDTGEISTPGTFSNLPAGEVFISPTSATGTLVVDGTMMPHGRLTDRTLRFELADGYVTAVDDDALREQMETAAEAVGQAAYNVAELGIGTNTGVTELIGSVLLDEKAAGTVHVAIGDDAGIGGDTEAPLHLDGIITQPTVTVDGTPLSLPEPTG